MFKYVRSYNINIEIPGLIFVARTGNLRRCMVIVISINHKSYVVIISTYS